MFQLPEEIIFLILQFLSDEDYIRLIESDLFLPFKRQRDCFERFRRSITDEPKEYSEFDWYTLLKENPIEERPCTVCQRYFLKLMQCEWNPKCNNLECSQYKRSGSFGNKSISNSYYEYGWF
jgi:hypothetical protein